MTTRRTMLAAMAAMTGTTLLPGAVAHAASGASAAALTNTSLKDIASRKGIRFGTAIANRPNQFGDPAYRALVERECNIIVAETEMKWQQTEPAKGTFTWQQADEMAAWARDKNLALRGHNLFWQPEKWLPSWVVKEDFGAQPAKAVEALMRERVRTETAHFGAAVISWDVMNEAVDPADGKMRENVLTKPLGAIEQVDLAFRLAREYAPTTELVYNDYMRDDAGSAKHRAGVLTMLGELKKRGTPINAVGLQSHIGSWDESKKSRSDLVEWRKFLDELSGMGFNLLITEFDVNDRLSPADITVRDRQVAAQARDYLDLTLSYPNLRDFLCWGIADHISWLQTWDEAPRKDKLPMRPLPYDAHLKAKPLREAIAAAISAAPARKAKA
jgi:endo-1,4-beta-xylanase